MGDRSYARNLSWIFWFIQFLFSEYLKKSIINLSDCTYLIYIDATIISPSHTPEILGFHVIYLSIRVFISGIYQYVTINTSYIQAIFHVIYLSIYLSHCSYLTRMCVWQATHYIFKRFFWFHVIHLSIYQTVLIWYVSIYNNQPITY